MIDEIIFLVSLAIIVGLMLGFYPSFKKWLLKDWFTEKKGE